ncbi:DUF2243 domain-containing protein [Natrialba asiatica]|uniref:DUF2243 domain-containing protein n=1 Tax=Natrialba asiatica (strain ATCC 700177 / DSM 12278 / JCM 9576 / FERM P-10747 / NBRC 102637 / 172P1) TaxID=29540 RepID=M0AS09_NATA1|nr:DUF2243 domain-containing protein [Natrialba asiatica]ELZ00164.1 hypothetical protein C481_14249 [Natrialba asiatica DSM 12278]
MSTAAGTRRRLLLAGGTIGFGFGAVIDTVIFHLTFQTHHLLSGYYDPYSLDGLRTNVMFDGLFLVATLGITLVGLGLLWRIVNGTAERLSTRYLIGSIVVGAGVFNVYDGIVDHYVLDLHNVVHGTEAWNPPWILVSVLLLALGLALLRTADGPVLTAGRERSE